MTPLDCALHLVRKTISPPFFDSVKRISGADMRPVVEGMIAQAIVTECTQKNLNNSFAWELFALEITWMGICLTYETIDEEEIKFAAKSCCKCVRAVMEGVTQNMEERKELVGAFVYLYHCASKLTL